MTRRFSFHPTAEQELNETAAYYETESQGLGSSFLKEVERIVEHVIEYPEAGVLVNSRV